MNPDPGSSLPPVKFDEDDECTILNASRCEPLEDADGQAILAPGGSHTTAMPDNGPTMLAPSPGSSEPSRETEDGDESLTLNAHEPEPPVDDDGQALLPPHHGQSMIKPGEVIETPASAESPEPPPAALPGPTDEPVPAGDPAAPAENYRAGREIARGGMGRILEADDRKLRRAVALKEMLPRAAGSESARQRFLREAEVLALLAHPNIVPVYDLVWQDGQPHFYTMKLVHGRTLKDILQGLRGQPGDLRDFTLDRLLSVFRKVCDALAFAHSKGILHRDLKPENIMVGEFGEVLVMDWGLAKVLGEPASAAIEAGLTAGAGPEESETEGFTGGLTMEGAVMGTPQFMSPEQARGEVEGLDARSDIYSLGGILYQILTLRPPIEGRTVAEMLEKVGSGSITPPSEYGGTATPGRAAAKGEVLKAAKVSQLPHLPGWRVPAALSAVAMKALRLEKAERYQQVSELSAELEAYQTGFATKAEGAGLGKQLVLLIRRHKGIFTTAAAAWLLIIALGLWFIINLRAKERRAVAGEQRAVAGEASAREAEAVAKEEKESARQSLAQAAQSLAETTLRDGDGPAMQAALSQVPEDLRDSTWRYLFEQSDTSIARIRTGTNDLQGVAAHPRQPSVFAVADGQRKVTILNVRTGQRLLEFTPGLKKFTGQLRIVFSADGERIAVGQAGNPGGIVVHSARDGQKLLQWDAPVSSQLEFSSDGTLLLQKCRPEQLQVWDVSKGQAAWSWPAEPAGYVRGAFTPDGQQVITTSLQEGPRLVNARDGTLIRTLPTRSTDLSAIAIPGDGTATFASRWGEVLRLSLRDGKVLADFRAGDRDISHLRLTPDGRRIVTVVPLPNGRQEIRLWDANSGTLVQSLSGGSGGVRSIAVHPLSGELFVSGPSSRVWSLMGTPERWALRGGGGRCVAFWGSEDVIFAPSPGYQSALQKLQAGSTGTLWKGPSSGYSLPTVSADGQFAALGVPKGTQPIVLLRHSGPQVEQVATFKPAYSLSLLRLSPAGDRLLATESTGSGWELFETASGTQPVRLDRKEIKKASDFGWLDGRRLLGLVTAREERGNPGSEEWIAVWDVTTGKLLQTVTHRTAMNVLAIAPDGRRFAEAGVDKKVRLRDTATLAVQQEFRAHDGPITALAWHPSRPILATASADLSIRLWDLETGRRLEELRGPVEAPDTLAFSPSGRRLACSAGDGVARIWEPQALNEKPATPQETGGWEDLLAPLTPALVTPVGPGWRLEEGALYSQNKGETLLALAGDYSGTSYQVRLRLRRLAPKDLLYLKLPVGDREAGFVLDGTPAQGFYTGLSQINGKSSREAPGAVHGLGLKDTEQHDLEVTVRLNGLTAKITVTLDGSPLYEWAGPIASLSLFRDKQTTPRGTIALSAHAADWVVYEVKAKRLEK